MNKSEQLIACLEGEIAKRDEELAACRVAVENCEVFRARIAELEADRDRIKTIADNYSALNMDAQAELAAIKAQEPVACIQVTREFLEEIADSLDYDVRDVRDKVRSLLAAPVSEAKAQGVTDEQAAFEAAVAAVNERGWSTSTDLARQIWDAARIDVADCPPSYRGGKE